MPVVAVLGLGEAGSLIARDLVSAGVRVLGWDPAPRKRAELEVVPLAESGEAAVAGATVVLSVNSASVALQVALDAAPNLAPGTLYCDLNTAAPALKVRLASVVEARGAAFVDVALMAPVPGRGLRTPALVSGSGAAAFERTFRPLGMPVEVADVHPGSAATRKLLRSIFMKGWAAAVVEALHAAEKAGCRDWLYEDIARTFTQADAALVRRFVEGSYHHAARRVHEMAAAIDLLAELGVSPHVALAAHDLLVDIAHGRSPAPPELVAPRNG